MGEEENCGRREVRFSLDGPVAMVARRDEKREEDMVWSTGVKSGLVELVVVEVNLSSEKKKGRMPEKVSC